MADFPFTALGFDLDGTLLDTSRDLGTAVNHALALGGFDPVPLDSATHLIGGGAKVMLARAVEQQGGMPPDEFHLLYKRMLAFYGENNAVHTQPYPHAREVLADLAARGVTMAVVTNKFESFARRILGELDLLDPFVTVIGGDTLGKGRAKPAPDPIFEAQRRCGANLPGLPRLAFVGDSSYDVLAARAAGVPVIAAGYGYCDKPPHELGADAVIDSLAGLIGVLEGL
ncbi:MAG: phosphoglycolate phosphatase [Erythrobacter sp.]|nr:phosphoglycolate phosphatase [Erythrobacter sp.]